MNLTCNIKIILSLLIGVIARSIIYEIIVPFQSVPLIWRIVVLSVLAYITYFVIDKFIDEDEESL